MIISSNIRMVSPSNLILQDELKGQDSAWHYTWKIGNHQCCPLKIFLKWFRPLISSQLHHNQSRNKWSKKNAAISYLMRQFLSKLTETWKTNLFRWKENAGEMTSIPDIVLGNAWDFRRFSNQRTERDNVERGGEEGRKFQKLRN